MSGESEEKKFPPSAAKIKRARKEGQLPHSRDLVLLSMLPTLLWLYFDWSAHRQHLLELFAFAFRQEYALSSAEIIHRVVPITFWLAFNFVLPIVLMTLVISFVISIADNGGFVFSAKPVTPDFERINPAEGLKRLFSVRSAVETLFALVKMAIFALIVWGLMLAARDGLVAAQACGLGCMGEAFVATVGPIIAVFVALLIIFAVVDFLLSRQLFRHEMRMSHTEMKHDNKETYGSPEVKRRQRDEGRSMMSGPGRLGVRASTLVIHGRGVVIGLRYVPGETPAPLVVVKAAGQGAEEVLATARDLGVPVAVNLLLAKALFDRGFLGQFIPTDTFAPAASEIIKAGG